MKRPNLVSVLAEREQQQRSANHRPAPDDSAPPEFRPHREPGDESENTDDHQHARRNGSSARGKTIGNAVVRKLSEVVSEILVWLWLGRFPLGKLSLICGDPGLGKSFITLDITARVSRGALWPDAPDMDNPVGSVVLFNSEDDLGDTIKPRLEAANADMTKIVAVQGIQTTDSETGEASTRGFNLATDLPRLVKVLDGLPDCRLVIIDPISAYCGETDSHKNADVRSMLAPLAELASQRKLAVVCITHLSKGAGGKAVYRATGSLAFAAAARAVWMVARDANDKARRLLLPVKMNLAEESTGLAYTIQSGRVVWESNPIEMTADEFLNAEVNRERENSDQSQERQQALLWLENLLRDGPLPSKEIKRQGEECGFTWSAVKRAKKAAKVAAIKSGFGDETRWLWRLPGDRREAPDQKSPVTEETSPLRPLRGFPDENAQESDAESRRGAPPECQPLRIDDPAAGSF